MTDETPNPIPDPQNHAQEESAPPPQPRNGVGILGLIAVACAVTVWSIQPPRRDAAGFSTPNALKHLEVIAAEPRPLASEYNGAIRDYLVDEFNKLGLETKIQTHRYNDMETDRVWDIGNVLARHVGNTRDKAVVIAAHFDTVEGSPGAGDDGAAVAAMLEVARVLVYAGARKRDVYFLVTDGEERGLWGAQAFTQASDEIEFTGVVFNFEARGSSGPSIMFETVGSNAWLVAEYARAVPHPVASSISDDLYRHMPNDTDLSAFAEAGIPGMNFAFIGSPENYHSPTDTIANLDEASLRHHGLTMLGLAMHFGDLESIGAPDDTHAVYFTAPWIGCVHYADSLATASAIIAVVGAALACIIGLAARWVRPGRLLAAMVLAVIQMGLVGAVTYAILLARDGGLTTTSAISGHVLLSAALTLIGVMLCGRLAGLAEMALAAIAWTAIFGLMTAPDAPASSYLFVWPALFGSVAWLIIRSRPAGKGAAIIAALLTVPAIVIVLPVAYLAVVGLGMQTARVIGSITTGYPAAMLLAFFPALLVWQILTPLHIVAPRSQAVLAGILTVGGVVCYVM